MAKKKTILSWRITLATLDRHAEFFVEAKPKKKWVRVGGPFDNRTDANTFAQKYSADHPDIEVQVVAEQ